MKSNSAFFEKKHLASFALVMVFVLVVTSCARTPVGTLDPTFGANGIVTVDFGSDSDSGNCAGLFIQYRSL